MLVQPEEDDELRLTAECRGGRILMPIQRFFLRRGAALKTVHIIGCRSEEFSKHFPYKIPRPSSTRSASQPLTQCRFAYGVGQNGVPVRAQNGPLGAKTNPSMRAQAGSPTAFVGIGCLLACCVSGLPAVTSMQMHKFCAKRSRWV